MKTKDGFLFGAILASAVALGLSLPAFAQSDSQKGTRAAKPGKFVAKPHKVWTNDDMGRLRSPSDAYVEAKEKQPEKTAAAGQTTIPGKQPAANPAKPAVRAPLAIAKSVDDADKKIAWEKRDIEGQEEYVERLQKELEQAPPDRKEQLQKTIEEHQQIIADTRQEMQGLENQKSELQKKPSVSASAEPPSQ